MKIVLVGHVTLDWNSGAAGAMLALGREFERAGHEISFLSHDDLPKLPGTVLSFVFPLFCAWRLWRRHRQADVVDANPVDGWLSFLLRRRSRTLHVTTSHGMNWPIHERRMQEVAAGRARVSWRYRFYHGSVYLWMEGLSLAVADLLLVLNEHEKAHAATRWKVPVSRIRLVRNGLGERFLAGLSRHAGQIEAAPADQTQRARRLNVVQVGSYEERKGIDATRQAMTALMQARPDVRLTFLGTTRPAEDTLRDYPQELWPRIAVVPRFDNADLPRLLSGQEIFLMPSKYDAFGIAPLEAMACGLVPIVTDTAGPAVYMRNEENGLVVPVDSPAALETAIARLIDDDALYARLQEGARATEGKFRWPTIAVDRLALYAEFLARKRRGTRAAPSASRLAAQP